MRSCSTRSLALLGTRPQLNPEDAFDPSSGAEIADHLARRIAAGRAGDAAAGMGRGTAHETGNWHSVSACPSTGRAGSSWLRLRRSLKMSPPTKSEVALEVAIKWGSGSSETVRAAARMGGYLRSKPEPHHEFLAALRAEKSDITLQALCDRLPAERGVRADTSVMSCFFRRIGVTLKKTLVVREQDRPDIKRHRRPSETRRSFRVWSSSTRPGPMTNWTKTNMTRFYGWAPRRRRLVAKVPHGHWRTATLLVALRNDRRAFMDTSTGATIIHCEAREGNTEYTLIDS